MEMKVRLKVSMHKDSWDFEGVGTNELSIALSPPLPTKEAVGRLVMETFEAAWRDAECAGLAQAEPTP